MKIKSVFDLEEFKKTAIYNAPNGIRLRNGNNSMIALFMAMFAIEVFPKFNEVCKNHFKCDDYINPNEDQAVEKPKTDPKK